MKEQKYTYDDVMQALRKADEAGNVEDAKRLAQIAYKMRGEDSVKDSTDTSRGFMPYMTRGISQSLGMPADAIRSVANLIPGVDIQPEQFGSRAIELGLGGMGARIPDKEASPETLTEHIGRGVGEVAGFALPTGIVTKMLAGGAGAAGNVARELLQTMGKHPTATLLGEVGGGVGAGAGRYYGEQAGYPEIAELAGGMAGGMTPAIAGNIAKYFPIIAGTRMATRALKKASLPFTEKGSMFRAGEYLKKQVADPEQVAGGIGKETISDIPHTIATGEKRLIGLLQQFRQADPVTDADFIDKTAKAINQLRWEMREIGLSDTEILREVTEKRMDSLVKRMDARITKAQNKADSSLQGLTPSKRKIDESLTVRNELDTAYLAAKAERNKLWEEVPLDLDVDTTNTKGMYESIVGNLSEAQKNDIPFVLKRSSLVKDKKPITSEILDAKGKPIVTEPTTITTARELWGLRSKLLEESRIARASGKFNKARIADEVSDAILVDLGAKAGTTMTDAGQKLNTALRYTREFEGRFHQGVVGKILGLDKSGAPRISPELTLDISIGRAGARGIVDMDKVLVTPEAQKAAQRYITRSFTDYTLDKTTGLINPNKAQTWLQRNNDVLTQFPALKKSLTNVNEAQMLANKTKVLMDARKARLQDPNISYASRFLNRDVENTVESILRSKEPVRYAVTLKNLARRDEAALKGVKGAFVEDLLGKSATGAYNEAGEQMLSGKAMNAYLNEHINVYRQIFSQEEIARIKMISNELSRLELATGVAKPLDVNFEDMASNLLQIFGRVSGAQIGRVVARLTGGGTVQTPGIFSQRFSKLAGNLTKDRAFQIVHDAIVESPELLRTLLLPIDKPGLPQNARNIQLINEKMNLWLMGSGKRIIEDIAIEEKED